MRWMCFFARSSSSTIPTNQRRPTRRRPTCRPAQARTRPTALPRRPCPLHNNSSINGTTFPTPVPVLPTRRTRPGRRPSQVIAPTRLLTSNHPKAMRRGTSRLLLLPTRLDRPDRPSSTADTRAARRGTRQGHRQARDSIFQGRTGKDTGMARAAYRVRMTGALGRRSWAAAWVVGRGIR